MEVETFRMPPEGPWSRRLQTKIKPKACSVRVDDWPTQLGSDLAWEPSTCSSAEEHTLRLTNIEVDEIRAALRYFNGLGIYGNEVSMDNFPLPTLGEKLLQIAVEVHQGRGFAVVHGLDPAEFSPEDNVIIFLGISSYIGPQRGRQDQDGNMLMHIRDAKLSRAAQDDRPTRYSSRASTFHTDTFCDVLALQTRSNASQGGRNILASSWTVYNRLAIERPDLVELLAQPIWPFDSRGSLFECSTRPLLFHHSGRILLNFAREPLLGLEGVQRNPGLGVLSPLQREALDLLEVIARESQIVLDAEPGDMLFVNNHGILHSREAFQDAPDASRYLVRLWLKHPILAWKLPSQLQDGNSRIYDDIGVEERWNVVDMPRIRFRLSERLTS